MRNMVVKLAWILVIAVHAWRRFSRLVNFLLDGGHVWIVQRISSPLVLWWTQVRFINGSVISNDDTFTHSTGKWRSIWLGYHLRMLANYCALVVVLQVSTIHCCVWSLRACLLNMPDHSRRSSIHWVTSTICRIHWTVIAVCDCYRVVFFFLELILKLYFLVDSLLWGMV